MAEGREERTPAGEERVQVRHLGSDRVALVFQIEDLIRNLHGVQILSCKGCKGCMASTTVVRGRE